MEYKFKASRLAALRAAYNGRLARRDDRPVTDNPFNAAGNLAERTLARYWVRGWTRTRTPGA